jgi:hypothetical protein
MKRFIISSVVMLATVAISLLLATTSHADPLPFRDLPKFDQEPMINTTITNTTGQVGVYHGHDEISTIYGPGNNATQPIYQGSFMADDFSDTLSSPVVHVTWWGSYHGAASAPQPPVQQFLIAFDSDDPAIPPSPNNPGSPSKPKAPIQYEIVNSVPFGPPLAPASGTFTEQQVGGPDINGDLIYKYNAELANPFPEQANQVYWLKIAALVNVPVGTPVPPPPGITQWGWHNRDYTINDPLAAPVLPGEVNQGTAANPIWHFQDDAVQGRLTYNPIPGTTINQQIIQTNPLPQNYVDLADGPQGIGNFSKDLAFRLYTTNPPTPEPTSALLLSIGVLGAVNIRRRRG